MSSGFTFRAVVKETDSGRRLDAFLASAIPGCSRSFAASTVTQGHIKVSGTQRKAGYRVKTGDIVSGVIPKSEPSVIQPKPESISIHILFEDDHILMVNKPAGMVVHPAPGHASGTLVNALLYHSPQNAGLGEEYRSGIVHRLDKDTSGVMVIAKTPEACRKIYSDFKKRKNIQKTYLALVYGEMKQTSGVITLPVGRHPVERKKMSTTSRKPREAETLWKVRARFCGLTLLEVEIKTGRTHQIRVHFSAENHPVVGDKVYGTKKALNRIKGSKVAKELVKGVSRQMLHAWKLGIQHPETGKGMVCESPLPDDMDLLIKALRSAR